MKSKIGFSTKFSLSVQLKRIFLYGGSLIALTGIVGLFFYFYLNVGIQESARAASPTSISGVINSYLRVTAINVGTRTFTADNLSGNISDFQQGKTIIIYQAKGATINTTNSSSYGVVTAYNNAGLYEFAVVSSISGSGPYTIVVSSLSNSYTAAGYVQLVSVPSYTNASVDGTINAIDWSATQGRGGIVALEVYNELTLGGNIDVSGRGFTGGQTEGSDASCPNSTTYRSNSNSYAAKGEGISTDGRLYARAPQANGGGGGNPHNAGGAGGSNHTIGGYGGQGYQPGGCAPASAGGIAGNKFSYVSSPNRIYFGGGGGAGQQNEAKASSGANGGGIIIIRANTITSSCGGTYGILSNGDNASNSLGTDGSGGGGGGGTIVLDVLNYNLSCGITVMANGGNGGNSSTTTAHAGGGGGGIGIIMETYPTSDPNVIIASAPGSNGLDCLSGACPTPSGQLPETPASYKISIASVPGQVTTLPVELIAFNGKVVDEFVELEWLTASEQNNDYFTVERSSDGNDFTSIDNVKGAGTSKSIHRYSIQDKGSFSRMVYYRLRQTDFDGKFTYSNTIFVDTHDLSGRVLVYPNPASSVVNVVNANDQLLSIRFLNNRGVVVKTELVNDSETRVDISTLQEGIYLLELNYDTNKDFLKLVVKR